MLSVCLLKLLVTLPPHLSKLSVHLVRERFHLAVPVLGRLVDALIGLTGLNLRLKVVISLHLRQLLVFFTLTLGQTLAAIG